MYEFLAPWGVIAPAVSAVLAYASASEIRRKKLMRALEAPEGTRVFSGMSASNGLA